MFDHLWPEMKRINVDLVDEHFYRPEDWFLSQGNRYDNYDREGPKVFVGEYACHGKGHEWNHFNASLLEAAFMTGLERNSDVVHMATYAPLFAHVDGWNWRPDLIWYDNLRSVRSCSYYVQQMYACNPGTHVLKTTAKGGKPMAGNVDQGGLFASAVWDADRQEVILKIVNVSDTDQSLKLTFAGLKKNQKPEQIDITTYRSDDIYADNTLENPTAIVPQVTTADCDVPEVFVVTAKTFVMCRFKVDGRK
jgi:alpha-L-arabinofuranosidase